VTPDLAAFSDWALALLPRLFVYPGGFFLLAALALLRFASVGVGSLSRSAVLRDLAGANTMPLALAWSAAALLPVPGWPLPFAPGPLALALLLALSLLLDITPERGREQALAGGAITLALLVPPLQGMPGIVVWGLAGLSLLAGLSALDAMRPDSLTDQVRAVGWLWLWLSGGPSLLPVEQPWLAPVVLLAAALVPGLVLGVVRGGRGGLGASPAIAWSLALPALLAALLFGR
jgi:hypothetical protein